MFLSLDYLKTLAAYQLQPSRCEGSLYQVYPNTTINIVWLTVFFMAAHLVTQKVYPNIWKNWRQESKWKLNKLETIIEWKNAYLQNFLFAVAAWFYIISDHFGAIDSTATTSIYIFIERILIPWRISYLITDTFIYRLPEFLSSSRLLQIHLGTIVHHALILNIFYQLFLKEDGDYMNFLIRLIANETTTSFLICWTYILNNTYSNEDTTLLRNVLIAAAVTFTLITFIDVMCLMSFVTYSTEEL